jgi:hypothetical protein
MDSSIFKEFIKKIQNKNINEKILNFIKIIANKEYNREYNEKIIQLLIKIYDYIKNNYELFEINLRLGLQQYYINKLYQLINYILNLKNTNFNKSLININENLDMYFKELNINITSWEHIDLWVIKYCIVKNKTQFLKSESDVPIEFSNVSINNKLKVEVYDRGHAGKNDCLIISLLSCLSQKYRLCEKNLRFEIVDYFRRNYLPYFFKENKYLLEYSIFKGRYTKNTSNKLFILNDLKSINLLDLLTSKNVLIDLIIELILHHLKINFFMISHTYGSPEYYSFTCNQSNKTICMYGDNIHYRSCKMNYNNSLSYIADIDCTQGENIIKNDVLRKCNFKEDDKVKYIGTNPLIDKNKIYTVYDRDYKNSYSNNYPKYECLFLFIGDSSESNYKPKYNSLNFNSTSILINNTFTDSNKSKKFLTRANRLQSDNYFIKKDGKFIKLYRVRVKDCEKHLQKNIKNKNDITPLDNNNNKTPPPLMPIIENKIYKELNIKNIEKYEDILFKIYYKILEKNPEFIIDKDKFDIIFFKTFVKPIIRSLKNTNSIITEEKIDEISEYVIKKIKDNDNFYNQNYNENLSKILKPKYSYKMTYINK